MNPVVAALIYFPFFLIPCLIFGFLGFKAKKWIFNRQYRKLIIYVISLLALGPLIAIIEVQAVLGGFGPGAIFYGVAPAIGGALAGIFVILGSVSVFKSHRNAGIGHSLALFLLVVVMALPLSVALIPMEMDLFMRECDTLNQQEVAKIINAMNTYQKDHANYPKSVDELSPNYLASAPRLPCPMLGINLLSALDSIPTRGNPDFQLGTCGKNTPTVLRMNSTSGIRFFIFNVETGTYDLYDFLDGFCDFTSYTSQ